MFIKLLLAFTLIPVIELYLLINVGALLGPFNTVLLVIVTGLAGAYLARIQGLQTLFRVRTSLQQGIMPAEELLDALLIFVAGVVLITPGLLTDAAGLLLLLPPVRSFLKQWLKGKGRDWLQVRRM